MSVSAPAYDRAATPLQYDDELDQLIGWFVHLGVRSYLEIGARYGGSFGRVMMALGERSRGVCVDFPGAEFGDENSPVRLFDTLARLRRRGREVSCVLGPSAAQEVVARVQAFGPFDAVFIDADHRYAAVRLDFEIYAPLARVVALHDIAAPDHVTSRRGTPVGVPQFWAEVKTRYPYIEIYRPDTLMGIGIVFPQGLPKELS